MVSTRLLTADDLFRLGPDAPYELIEGELAEVMSPQGRVHGRILSNLNVLLDPAIRANQSGELLAGDVGFILARNPDTVLAPDLAFIRTERLENAGDGYLELAPDLAVEIVSPSNTGAEIARKVGIYLAAGTEEVWVVRPREREVAIYRQGTGVAALEDNQRLESDLLPGFSLQISDIF